MVYGMHDTLTNFIAAFNNSQKLSSPQFSTPMQFSPQQTFPLATLSPTRTPQPTRVLIKDIVSTKVIVKGDVIPMLKGEKVHGRNIQDYETKLSVICVKHDEIDIRLYLSSQGCATTIG